MWIEIYFKEQSPNLVKITAHRGKREQVIAEFHYRIIRTLHEYGAVVMCRSVIQAKIVNRHGLYYGYYDAPVRYKAPSIEQQLKDLEFRRTQTIKELARIEKQMSELRQKQIEKV